MKTMNRRSFLKATAAAGALAAFSAVGNGVAAAEETKPLHVKAAFFSPTDGTRNAVGMLAAKISSDVEYVNMTTPESREAEVAFAREDLAIVAAPSYGGQLPMIKDLFANLKGDQTPCVVVCAFGNRAVENVYAQLAKIVSERGFIVVGAIGLVTPHVFSEKAGHARPNIEDNQIMKEFAAKLLDKLAAGAPAAIAIEGDPEINWEKTLSVAQKVYNAENCVKCQECVKNCPMGAISAETIEVDESKCIHCQRCTFVCQFNGRTYDASPVRAFIESKLCTKKPVEYIL